MENPVDRSTIHFFERLNEFAGKEEVIEICDWLHHFAFDTIGGLAVCKPSSVMIGLWGEQDS